MDSPSSHFFSLPQSFFPGQPPPCCCALGPSGVVTDLQRAEPSPPPPFFRDTTSLLLLVGGLLLFRPQSGSRSCRSGEQIQPHIVVMPSSLNLFFFFFPLLGLSFSSSFFQIFSFLFLAFSVLWKWFSGEKCKVMGHSFPLR